MSFLCKHYQAIKKVISIDEFYRFSIKCCSIVFYINFSGIIRTLKNIQFIYTSSCYILWNYVLYQA